jgi:hypothetical protein
MTTSTDRQPGGRPHSLAPEHLGDVWAGSALAIVVLGVAIFIVAIGMVVSGLTASSSQDPANLPPNADTLGTTQLIAGVALFAVGVVLAGGGLALLTGSRRARKPVAILAIVASVAAIVGGVLIVLRGPSDLVLVLTLIGLGLGLGIAGLLLLRPRP